MWTLCFRWWEHLQELLKLETINQIHQQPVMEQIHVPHCRNEFLDAMRKPSNNKAPGPDGIPVEILKKGCPEVLFLLRSGTRRKSLLQLEDVLSVTEWKKICNADWNSYRSISLLSTTGKVLTRILSSQLLPLSEEILPESQCGFHSARGIMTWFL